MKATFGAGGEMRRSVEADGCGSVCVEPMSGLGKEKLCRTIYLQIDTEIEIGWLSDLIEKLNFHFERADDVFLFYQM